MSQHKLLEQLILALRRRQMDEADRILEQARQDPTFDINQPNILGETIVHLFCSPDRIPELRWLKAAGADFNARNRNGETLMMEAVLSSSAELVQALLDMGVDPNVVNARGVAPLMQAVLNHKENGITEILLKGGADPDPRSETGSTPLLAAASRGRASIVAALLDAGADPKATDFQGIGLLTSAVLAMDSGDGAAAVLQVIKDRAIPLDPNAPAKSGTTPMAAAISQIDALSILFDMGGDPNARMANRVHDGVTLLESVVMQIPTDIPIKKLEEDPFPEPNPEKDPAYILARKFLERGADPSIRNNLGSNAGRAALGNARMLGDLVAKGLDPKRPLDRIGTTPWDALLGVASNSRQPLDIDQAKAWIDRVNSYGFDFERPVWDEAIDGPKPPAPVLAKGEKEPSPAPILHLFVGAGQYELAWHMVSRGASSTIRDELGRGLSHVLVSTATGFTANERIALSMIGRAGNVDKQETDRQIEEITRKAQDRLDGIRRDATRNGVDWDAADNMGNTALHLAASKGNLEWTRWLVMNAGVAMDARNHEGLTAAGVALKHGHAELAYALIKVAERRGKDLRTDLLTDTVLASEDDSSLRRGWLMAVEALEPYLNWTAEDTRPSRHDPEKREPVFLAASTQMDDVMEMLLRYGGDPNARDENGNTALMAAVYNKDGEIIRQLRSMGCDIAAKNNAGQTAQDVANWVKGIYIHQMLNSNEGLDEIRDQITGKAKKLTDEQQAELDEDRRWFQTYLDTVVDYFFQKATKNDLSRLEWDRPMAVRARKEEARRREEALAKAAAAASASQTSRGVEKSLLEEDKSPPPRRPGP